MQRNTIVFDLDGTLVDSSKIVMNAFNYALQPFDLKVMPHQIEKMRSMTSSELFRDILSENDARIALAAISQLPTNRCAAANGYQHHSREPSLRILPYPTPRASHRSNRPESGSSKCYARCRPVSSPYRKVYRPCWHLLLYMSVRIPRLHYAKRCRHYHLHEHRRQNVLCCHECLSVE